FAENIGAADRHAEAQQQAGRIQRACSYRLEESPASVGLRVDSRLEQDLKNSDSARFYRVGQHKLWLQLEVGAALEQKRYHARVSTPDRGRKRGLQRVGFFIRIGAGPQKISGDGVAVGTQRRNQG